MTRDQVAEQLDDACDLKYPEGVTGIDRSPCTWWRNSYDCCQPVAKDREHSAFAQ